MTLNEYFRSHAVDTRLKQSTISDMMSTLHTLNKFGDVRWKDADHNFLRRFDAFLRTGGRCDNTIAKIHRHLRKIMGMAVYDGLIQHNPYNRFKPAKHSSLPKFLSEKEMMDIVSVGGLYADVFHFQCLTGMHISDILDFNKDKVEDISYGGRNYKMIRGRRRKTGELYNIPLSEMAEEIASRHGYVFNVSPVEYNNWLKKTASDLGITKKVTSSVGRHTFATTSLTNGMPIESVSAMLGHSSVTTTEIYARVTGHKVLKDLHKISNHAM